MVCPLLTSHYVERRYLLIKHIVELSHRVDALGFAIRDDAKSMWIVTWLEDKLRRGDHNAGGHGVS